MKRETSQRGSFKTLSDGEAFHRAFVQLLGQHERQRGLPREFRVHGMYPANGMH